jgi:hypothetical protein
LHLQDKDLLAIVRRYIADESVLIQIKALQHSLALTRNFLALVEQQDAVLVISFGCYPVERFHRDSFRRRKNDRPISQIVPELDEAAKSDKSDCQYEQRWSLSYSWKVQKLIMRIYWESFVGHWESP